MRRGRCRSSRVGLYFAAFGFGMIVSMLCPKTVIVALLSLALVILGIIICK